MNLSVVIMIFTLLSLSAAEAQGLRATRPSTGYICMELALTDAQFTDPNVRIPVRATPSRTSPAVSYAPTIVIVQDAQQPSGGFLRVLQLNGEPGWMEARHLRPFRNPNVPSARCTPAIMSDGKPGFGTTQ